MKESSNQKDTPRSIRSSLKKHFNDKKLKVLNLLLDDVVKQVSILTQKPIELVEQTVNRLELRGGKDKDGNHNDGLVIYRERPDHHGPLSPLFPHECHVTIIICNPTPWGAQGCWELTLPWPCPDIIFEPEPWD